MNAKANNKDNDIIGIISIKISFTGVIDIKNISSDSILKLNTGSTINDVLEMAGIKREHRRFIVPTVNEEVQKLSYILKNEDHLFLFLPIGGG